MSSSRLPERTPAFFRKHYEKVILALIVLIFTILVVTGIVLYQVRHRPLPQFAAVNPKGEVLRLTPSDTPNLLPDTLLRWASKAAVASYTFDFVNYQKQLDAIRPYFTEGGWNYYQNSINTLISSIKQKQLFVSGVVAGPPVIASQGDFGGAGYTWRVQIPFLVTYQSSETTEKKRYTMMITIMKISTRQNPTGIGIDQLVMK